MDFPDGASGNLYLPAMAGDARDTGSIPGWGRCPGKGKQLPTPVSGLENPMDKGAWWVKVRSVVKSLTLKQLNSHTMQFYIPVNISNPITNMSHLTLKIASI